MRRALLGLVILSAFSTPASATTQFSYVQSAGALGTAAIPFSSSNTVGNTILVFASHALTSITDTRGNSYASLNTMGTGNGATVWASYNIGAGANSVTAVGQNVTGSGSAVVIVEYSLTGVTSGGSTVNALFNWQGGLNSSSPVSVNTLTNTSEVFVAMAAYDPGTFHSWTTSNMTVRQNLNEVGGQSFGVADGDVASAAYGTAFSLAGGCGGGCATVFVTGMVITAAASPTFFSSYLIQR